LNQVYHSRPVASSSYWFYTVLDHWRTSKKGSREPACITSFKLRLKTATIRFTALDTNVLLIGDLGCDIEAPNTFIIDSRESHIRIYSANQSTFTFLALPTRITWKYDGQYVVVVETVLGRDKNETLFRLSDHQEQFDIKTSIY
jgi:hypothetical protein